MRKEQFAVLKRHGTYADALAAVGLAHLLHHLRLDDNPLILDAGSHYEVVPAAPVDLARVDCTRLVSDPGYPYVKLAKDPNPVPPGSIDYEAERAKLLHYRELRKSLGADRSPEAQERLAAAAPKSGPVGWYRIQNLNVLQALAAWNSLHAAIRSAQPAELTATVAAHLANQPVGAEAPATGFSPGVSAVQAFNPVVGKGINRPKPDSTSPGGLPSGYVDWFHEYLRFMGWNVAAASLPLDNDIKVSVIVPGRITLEAIGQLQKQLDDLRSAWSAAMVDIQGVLALAGGLIDYSAAKAEDDPLSQLVSDIAPCEVVAGVQTALFKKMGSSRSLFSTGFIGLPGWLPVMTPDSATDWSAVVAEHRAVIRQLDEEKSEDQALLIKYRDFISPAEPAAMAAAFLEFAAGFAVFVAGVAGRRPVRLFTIPNLDRVVRHVGSQFTDVVTNKGFLEIATAIRRATVSQQFIKGTKGKADFEIHYGLIQELRRKCEWDGQFLAAVGEFVASYNVENARRSEVGKPGPKRPQVTVEALTELTRLVDTHKAKVVGPLLLAYATARDPRAPEEVPDSEGGASDE